MNAISKVIAHQASHQRPFVFLLKCTD